MTNQHTPGPWRKAGAVGKRQAVRILDSRGFLVAEARGAMGPWEESNGNARLIAAAPDLLEAILGIRDLCKYGGAFSEDVAKICDTAIHKATGHHEAAKEDAK